MWLVDMGQRGGRSANSAKMIAYKGILPTMLALAFIGAASMMLNTGSTAARVSSSISRSSCELTERSRSMNALVLGLIVF